jgi:hypothetical protein
VQEPIFPSRLAAKLTGATFAQLDGWAQAGLLAPARKEARSGLYSFRQYTFRDLVHIAVLRQLRLLGVESHPAGQRIIDYLKKRKGLDLKSGSVQRGTILLVDGASVREADSLDDLELRESLVVVALGSLVAGLHSNASKHVPRSAHGAPRNIGRAASAVDSQPTLNGRPRGRPPGPSGDPDALVTRLADFLAAHPHETFRAQQIADALGESERLHVVRPLLRQLCAQDRARRIQRGLFTAPLVPAKAPSIPPAGARMARASGTRNAASS